MKINTTNNHALLRWILLIPTVLTAFFLMLLLFRLLPFGPGTQSIFAFALPFFVCLTLPPTKKSRAICGVVFSSLFMLLAIGGTLAYIGSGAILSNDIIDTSLGMFFEESLAISIVGLIISITILNLDKEN